jgi:RNA polymerase sigma-70 factor (ECF subfamily)
MGVVAVPPRKLFEALVRENAQSLAIFVGGLVRDPGLADDVFQETLVTAWRQLERYDETRSFGRWLRGIARNTARARARRDARLHVLEHDAVVDLVDAHCEAVQRMRSDVLDERLDRLRDCLAALPESYRHTVELRYRDDLRGRGLAERLGTSWENAKKRLWRARQMLFECMQRKWSASEAPQ